MPVEIRQTRRDRFANVWSIVGLAGAGLLLLAVLFPEKNLLHLLSASNVENPAQVRYLEALVHKNAENTAFVIPLVRSYLAAGCTEKAFRVLEQQQGPVTKAQFAELQELHYELRRQQFEWLTAGEPAWEEVRNRYVAQIDSLVASGASPQHLSRYLVDARRLGDTQTADRLEALLGAEAQRPASKSLYDGAAQSFLAKRDYRGAAQVYLQGIATASVPAERRKLFLAGVRTLQSGNLMNEAMVAAEKYQYLVPLDRQSLLYLTKLALAANRAGLAQVYVRQALGMKSVEYGEVSLP